MSTDDEVPNSAPISKTVKSNVFAHKFTSWFYENLNNLCLPERKSNFSPKDFCNNAKSRIYLIGQNSKDEFESETNQACYESFCNIICSHKFLFSPNLDCGIRVDQSSFGMVSVAVCGTLHIGDNFIGIFEQEFGLAKNPETGSWQIFTTNLNLKSNVTVVPQLPPAPIFDVVIS